MNKKSGTGLVAREENRKRPERRSLPFGDSYLFHSELAGGARQQKTIPLRESFFWVWG